MATRYARTYNRQKEDSPATRAFDEAFGKSSVTSTTKASISKWGKTSYTAKKDKDENTSQPVTRKRRFSSEGDPYSFECLDDSSPKKNKNVSKKQVTPKKSSNKKTIESPTQKKAAEAVALPKGEPLTPTRRSTRNVESSVSPVRTFYRSPEKQSSKSPLKTIDEELKITKIAKSDKAQKDKSSEKIPSDKTTNNCVVRVTRAKAVESVDEKVHKLPSGTDNTVKHTKQEPKTHSPSRKSNSSLSGNSKQKNDKKVESISGIDENPAQKLSSRAKRIMDIINNEDEDVEEEAPPIAIKRSNRIFKTKQPKKDISPTRPTHTNTSNNVVRKSHRSRSKQSVNDNKMQPNIDKFFSPSKKPSDVPKDLVNEKILEKEKASSNGKDTVSSPSKNTRHQSTDTQQNEVKQVSNSKRQAQSNDDHKKEELQKSKNSVSPYKKPLDNNVNKTSDALWEEIYNNTKTTVNNKTSIEHAYASPRKHSSPVGSPGKTNVDHPYASPSKQFSNSVSSQLRTSLVLESRKPHTTSPVKSPITFQVKKDPSLPQKPVTVFTKRNSNQTGYQSSQESCTSSQSTVQSSQESSSSQSDIFAFDSPVKSPTSASRAGVVKSIITFQFKPREQNRPVSNNQDKPPTISKPFTASKPSSKPHALGKAPEIAKPPPPRTNEVSNTNLIKPELRTYERKEKKILSGRGKANAKYNPRPWMMTKSASVTESESSTLSSQVSVSSSSSGLSQVPQLKRTSTWPSKQSSLDFDDDPVTKLKIKREFKPLFKVVRNVKEAHECQEDGETQEFLDEVQYILDGLRDGQPMNTRCLSCYSLAQKCADATFRMHLRAHGIVIKIFSSLHDAYRNPGLALITACVMFILSSDRLNMDLDRESLELMLHLLSIDSRKPSKKNHEEIMKEYKKTLEKIKSLCEQIKKEGGAKNLVIAEITTANLAMETLLTLTSRKSADWFKEDIRELGGLNYIIDTVTSHCFSIEEDLLEVDDSEIQKFKRGERCLRILENVTFMNSENQDYLTNYKDGILIKGVCRVLKACENCLSLYKVTNADIKNNVETPGTVVIGSMVSLLKVLLNLTNDNVVGSIKLGEYEGILQLILLVVLQIPQYVAPCQRFDVIVLGLGLLINVVEHSVENRYKLMNTSTVTAYDSMTEEGTVEAPEALVQLFNQKHASTKSLEIPDDTDTESGTAITDGTEASSSAPSSSLPNVSGEWKESDSGVEWVVYNHDHEESNSDDEEGLLQLEQAMPTSQEEKALMNQALNKAGQHMEDSMVSSYVALLLGCLMKDNRVHSERIRSSLPDKDFGPMLKMLRKFLAFIRLTSAVGQRGTQSIEKIIDLYERLVNESTPLELMD